MKAFCIQQIKVLKWWLIFIGTNLIVTLYQQLKHKVTAKIPDIFSSFTVIIQMFLKYILK